MIWWDWYRRRWWHAGELTPGPGAATAMSQQVVIIFIIFIIIIIDYLVFRVFTDLKEVFEVYDLTALSRESEPEGFQKPGAYQKRNSYVTLIISSFFCIIIMLLLSSPVRYLLFLWPTLSYIFLLLITARYCIYLDTLVGE